MLLKMYPPTHHFLPTTYCNDLEIYQNILLEGYTVDSKYNMKKINCVVHCYNFDALTFLIITGFKQNPVKEVDVLKY